MKAQELVDKYKGLVYPYLGSGMLINQADDDVILKNAQICARITVEEILKLLKSEGIEYGALPWERTLKDIDKTV